jgi:hypothetical protein
VVEDTDASEQLHRKIKKRAGGLLVKLRR